MSTRSVALLSALVCSLPAQADTHWAFDDEVVWDGDHDLTTTNDQLRLNGSVYLDLFDAEACMLFMSGCGGAFGLTNTISVQTALTLEIGELGVVDQLVPLGSVGLGIIPLGRHWSIEPKLRFMWDVEATGGWDIETSLESDFAYEVDLTLGSLGGAPILSGEVVEDDVSTSPPRFGDETLLDLHVGLVGQLEFVVRYDGVPTSRPYVMAEPYWELDADPHEDPWWSMWAGYEVATGFAPPMALLDFLAPAIARWRSSPILEDRVLLASADTFATRDVDWQGVRWSQGYEFDAIETAQRVVPTLGDGDPAGLVIAAESLTDGFFLEVDSTGEPVNGVRYDGVGLADLAQASPETYIACGDAVGGTLWVGELDTDGEPLWTTQVDLGTGATCDRILPLPGGGYVLSGHIQRDSDYNTPLVVRLDDTGTVTWANSYDSPATDDDGFVLKDMDITSRGQIILVGRHGSDDASFHAVMNAFVISLDPDGQVAWERTLGGNHDGDRLNDQSLAEAVEVLDDDSIVITGQWKDGSRPNGMWLARLNAKGALQWSEIIESQDRGVHSQSEVGLSLQSSPSGILVGARAGSPNSSSQDAWLLRIKPDGTPRWLKVFDGPGATDIISLYGDEDRVVSLGTSTGLVGTRGDLWLSSGAVDGMEAFTASSGMTASQGLIQRIDQAVTMDTRESTAVSLSWTAAPMTLDTSVALPTATRLTE